MPAHIHAPGVIGVAGRVDAGGNRRCPAAGDSRPSEEISRFHRSVGGGYAAEVGCQRGRALSENAARRWIPAAKSQASAITAIDVGRAGTHHLLRGAAAPAERMTAKINDEKPCEVKQGNAPGRLCMTAAALEMNAMKNTVDRQQAGDVRTASVYSPMPMDADDGHSWRVEDGMPK